MVEFSASCIIHAPIEKVFACISDFTRIPEWRDDVPGISQISGPTEVGAMFVEDVNFMGKKKLLMKVVEYVPNRKLVVAAQSGMGLLPTQTFVLTPEGDTTAIELLVSLNTSGLFTIAGLVLPSRLKKIWKRYFANLNAILSE